MSSALLALHEARLRLLSRTFGPRHLRARPRQEAPRHEARDDSGTPQRGRSARRGLGPERGMRYACGIGAAWMSPATPTDGDLASRRVVAFELALLAAIVAWGAFARWDGLTGPFGRGWQWLGAFYGMQARNGLRYGLVETAFAGVVNADVAPREEWSWYVHHPPGTLWSMEASFALLGESAFASKLPAFLFGLLQIVATWRLARDALSPRAGLVAALLTAALPAGARFSTHGSELGPAVVALSVAALWLDERARRRDPEAPRSVLVVAAIVAGSLFCWAALTVPAFIAARDALRRRWRRAALFAALPVVLLALQLLHVRLATGSFGGGQEGSLLDAFLQSGVKGFRELAATLGPDRLARRLGANVVELFTVPGIALAAAGALLLLARRRIASLRGAPLVAPCLGALALVVGYAAPFPGSTLSHSYWLLTG